MSRRAKYSIGRNATGPIAVMVVFGLAIVMVVLRYDPVVITTVVTGTSLAAAELVRRLRQARSAPGESADRDEVGS